jgi:hypothetical protein
LLMKHQLCTQPPPPTPVDGRNIDIVPSGPAAWRAYLRALGPGLVTGASDDDPSGIATYAQTGAQFGFGMLWVALITFPLMAAVQEICDRTALATGKGLGELMVVRFGRASRGAIGVLIGALIIANALNIAADLVAIGAGMHLLHAGPATVWAVLAGSAIMILLVSGSFATIARVFKVLCAALLAYVVVLFLVKIPWGTVFFNTIVPHIRFSRTYILLLVGVLGTTISPYLFFWQSMHRLEEMREEDAGGARPLPLRRRSRIDAEGKQSRSRFDVFTGMAFSNVVMFAIIVSTAVHTYSEVRPPPHHFLAGSGGFSASTRRRSLREHHLCPRIHRLGHVGDSGPRRSRVGGDVRTSRQANGVFQFTTSCTRFLRAVRSRDRWWDGTQPVVSESDQASGARSCCQRCGSRAVHHRHDARLLQSDDHGRVRERASGKDSRMDNGASDGRRSYRALCDGRCIGRHRRAVSPVTIASPHAASIEVILTISNGYLAWAAHRIAGLT